MSKEAADGICFSRLTLGVVKSLEKRPGICDVKLEEKSPVENHVLTSWEQKYSCLMPDDIKNFYLTTNGFRLRWSTKMNDTRIAVGKMEINSIDQLVRIGGVGGVGADRKMPSLSDINGDNESDPDSKDANCPKFDHRSRIFELDPCDGYGKVCLVYNNTKPGIPAQKAEVWFLDRSIQWHMLAADFLSYYRLMLMHLGLPHWHYAFTDIGLPPQAKQWFNMYAPMRLDLQSTTSSDSGESSQKHLDVTKVFKGKSEKKKQPPSQNVSKKRPGAPPARSQTFIGRSAGLTGPSFGKQPGK